MPRPRLILDSILLGLVEKRMKKTPPAARTPEERALEAIRQILAEREAEIERLKSSDTVRAGLFRKCVGRLLKARRETRDLKARNRVLKRLLRERRAKLRLATQRLKELNLAALNRHTCMATVGQPIPLAFGKTQPGKFSEWLTRKLANFSDWPWKHWMVLGNYYQYDPRPLELDKIPVTRRQADDWPRVTLVTPSYQQAGYLERTLQSVIGQNYPNLEYIVLDGGSDDGSVEIIRRHAAHLAHWESRPDGGQAAAVREGLKRGSGEIMGWLNSDDLIFPGTLRYVADYFQRHPDVDVVFGHRIVIDNNDYETARWVLPRHDPEFLAWADFLPQECTFWRRRIYEKVDGIDPSFRFALDWDLFLRFQQAGAKMVRLPYFLGGFRVHPDQKNAVTLHKDGYPEMKRIRDNALGSRFQSGGLLKRMTWFQARAVMTTWLWRLGIRV